MELDAAQVTSMLDDAGIIQDSFLKATEFKPTDAIYIYLWQGRHLELLSDQHCASKEKTRIMLY